MILPLNMKAIYPDVKLHALYLVCYKLCLCLLLLANFKMLKQYKLLISHVTDCYICYTRVKGLSIDTVGEGRSILSAFLLHKMVYISFRSFLMNG